jgi:hypothetical protein
MPPRSCGLLYRSLRIMFCRHTSRIGKTLRRPRHPERTGCHQSFETYFDQTNRCASIGSSSEAQPYLATTTTNGIGLQRV